MTQTSDNGSIIRPTLHHFGLVTPNLERLIDWYAKAVGMDTVSLRSNTHSSEAGVPTGIAFVSNDRANHRLAIFMLPDLKDSTTKGELKLQHVAFEYAKIDDLLNSYMRMKKLGIMPILAMDHGSSISFYYNDPDGNTVELFVDTFGDWDKSTEYMRSQFSRESRENWMGAPVDAEKLVTAHQTGMSFAELHQRAYAGEFPPSR
jgi:catechol 2,3-dioxygenase